MFHSEYFFEPKSNIPKKDFWKALELSNEHRKEDLEAAKKFDEGISSIQKKYLNSLYKIIGSDRIEKYLNLHRDRINKIRRIYQDIPQLPENKKKINSIRKKIIKGSNRLINESGVNIDKINKLIKISHDKAATLFTQTIGKGEEGKEVEKGNNTDYFPPYDGWGWSYIWEKSDEPDDPRIRHWSDHTTGWIGTDSIVEVRGADNSDFSYVRYRVALTQWHRIPRDTPCIYVNADIDQSVGEIWGGTGDECGVSDVSFHQSIRFYARIISPYSTPHTYFSVSTPDAIGAGIEHRNTPGIIVDDWSIRHFPLTPTRYVELNGHFSEGDWIAIHFGIETYNYFWSNDVSILSLVDQRCWIPRIGIADAGWI